jgi:hypothetical protein
MTIGRGGAAGGSKRREIFSGWPLRRRSGRSIRPDAAPSRFWIAKRWHPKILKSLDSQEIVGNVAISTPWRLQRWRGGGV